MPPANGAAGVPDDTPDGTSEIRHASCVALNGRGLLILGRSGAGKSGLALELMARGATLVSDDRTVLTRRGDAVIASAPAAIAGLIEARGIGLLRADVLADAPVFALIDLDQREPDRLPQVRHSIVLGCPVILLLRPDAPQFAAGLLQFLRTGQRIP